MTELQQKCLEDRKYLIETFFEIRYEVGGVDAFIFNPVQDHYWQRRTKRDIILKSRKDGFSTLKLAEGLALAMTNPGWHSSVVVQEDKTYLELRENQMIMFEAVPEELRPSVSYDNVGSGVLYFDKLKSKLTISKAGASEKMAKKAGRGPTVNFLHLAEYAVYPFPEELYVSYSNSVPLDGYISIESTANGFNDFKIKVDESRAGMNNFKLHFYRWFDSPKNRIEDNELCYVGELTDYEKKLVDKHSLDIAQIRFRRFKIRENGERKFNQEYPENIDECFIHHGGMFFDEESLEKQRKNIKEPLAKQRNGVNVFVKPQRGRDYVIGADTSEGLQTGDYSSGTVLDRETGREVCHLYGKFTPEYFAKLLSEVGRKYNTAMLGVERNNHGHTVISRLKEPENYPKNALFYHDDKKIGWKTNALTRPIMLDEYSQAIREELIKISCEFSLSEHYHFIEDETGKPSGLPHDDTVFSKAIAWQVRKKRKFKQVAF